MHYLFAVIAYRYLYYLAIVGAVMGREWANGVDTYREWVTGGNGQMGRLWAFGWEMGMGGRWAMKTPRWPGMANGAMDGAGDADQYSIGNNMVVVERSASVIIQTSISATR